MLVAPALIVYSNIVPVYAIFGRLVARYDRSSCGLLRSPVSYVVGSVRHPPGRVNDQPARQRRFGRRRVDRSPTRQSRYGDGATTRRWALTGCFKTCAQIRNGRYAYTAWWGEAEPHLYDLRSDPDERHNLARKEKELARRLHRQLEAELRAASFAGDRIAALNAPRA